jgi:hypothetical protein
MTTQPSRHQASNRFSARGPELPLHRRAAFSPTSSTSMRTTAGVGTSTCLLQHQQRLPRTRPTATGHTRCWSAGSVRAGTRRSYAPRRNDARQLDGHRGGHRVLQSRCYGKSPSSDPGFENLGYVFDATTLVKDQALRLGCAQSHRVTTTRMAWASSTSSTPKTGDLLHDVLVPGGHQTPTQAAFRRFAHLHPAARTRTRSRPTDGRSQGERLRFDLSDPTSWPTSADLIAKLKDPSGKDQPHHDRAFAWKSIMNNKRRPLPVRRHRQAARLA